MPRKTGKSIIPMFILVAVLSTGWGQQAPVFHARAELVQVPVTVLGPKGKFVRGLTRKDFRLEVDGKPVEIEAVDAWKQPSPAQTEPQAAPLPPGVYSNRAERRADDRIVLLYDYGNIPLEYLPRLRQQLLDWFQHSMQPGQKVALFALNGGVDVLQPFTSDREALEATLRSVVQLHATPGRFTPLRQELTALDRMAGISAGASQGAENAGSSEPEGMRTTANGMIGTPARWSAQGLQRVASLQESSAFRGIAEGLNDLASVLEGVPGRKTVIWLTAGKSLTAIWGHHLGRNWEEYRTAVSRLNQADVALFPVDVTGLRTLVLSPLASFAPPRTGEVSQSLASHAIKVIGMKTAAEDTGGLAFVDNNDYGERITRIIRTTSNGYVVSFVPPAPRKGDPYRVLTLTTPGRPVTLLYRRQYREPQLARAGVEAKNFALSLRRLAIHPLDMGSVPLTVRTLPPGPIKKVPWPGLKHPVPARQHGFVLTIPYQSLLHSVPDAEGGYAFDFTCARVLVPLDQPDKLVVFRQNRFYVHTVTAAQKRMLAGHDATYHGTIPVPAGQVYLVRVVVRDNLDGKLGSVSFRVDGREQETARK